MPHNLRCGTFTGMMVKFVFYNKKALTDFRKCFPVVPPGLEPGTP